LAGAESRLNDCGFSGGDLAERNRAVNPIFGLQKIAVARRWFRVGGRLIRKAEQRIGIVERFLQLESKAKTPNKAQTTVWHLSVFKSHIAWLER
jgi:hypothetical protein